MGAGIGFDLGDRTRKTHGPPADGLRTSPRVASGFSHYSGKRNGKTRPGSAPDETKMALPPARTEGPGVIAADESGRKARRAFHRAKIEVIENLAVDQNHVAATIFPTDSTQLRRPDTRFQTSGNPEFFREALKIRAGCFVDFKKGEILRKLATLGGFNLLFHIRFVVVEG